MARRRKTIYNRSRKGDKFSRSKYSGSSTTVTMGKVFRTRGGRVGCYVYINGRRSHFEEKPNRVYTDKEMRRYPKRK